MAAPCVTIELESKIKEIGNKLSVPPSSIEELLDHLDKAEGLLSCVAQAPSSSMQEALLPSMGALISHELLRHSNVDVKLSVASCLSEITRITAPEKPYNDELMKEIFQLSVMAFGKLSNLSGRCYTKALHILNSTATVQSFLLMMDLEFDDLIAEMFQQFLSSIRSNHPHHVFSNMEKIMTTVIEESDEVSVELLSILLSSVKKGDQIVPPISWRLGEKILYNCAGILKAYLPEMLQSTNLDPVNYAEVVASICREAEHTEAEGLLTDEPETGTVFSKKRLRKRNSRLGGTLKNGAHSQKNSSQSGDGPLKEKFRGTEGALCDAEETVSSTEKIKDKNRSMGIATSGQKSVSPSVTTSIKRSGDQLSGALKKKSAPPKVKAHKNSEYGEVLVGRRIKVWWPLDQMYYDGAVAAFDPSQNRHTVLYADGDEEILNLHNEHWELLDDILSEQDQNDDQINPATSSDKSQKKKAKQNKVSSKQKAVFSVRQEPVEFDKSKDEATEIKWPDGGQKPTAEPCPIMQPKHKNHQNISSSAKEDHMPAQDHDLTEAEEIETRSGNKRRRLVEEEYDMLMPDGDEEILNLHDKPWQVLNDTSPDQDQNADLPCLSSQEEVRGS